MPPAARRRARSSVRPRPRSLSARGAVASSSVGVEMGERAPRRGARPPSRNASRSATGIGVADVADLGADGVAAAVGPRQAVGGRAEASRAGSSRRGGAPRGSARRVARSNRRWPPAVVNASIRPSSAQRRSVSGSTPSRRLAGPSESRSTAGRHGTGGDGHGDGDLASANVGKSGYAPMSAGQRRIRARADRPSTDRGQRGPPEAGVRRGRARGRRDGSRRTGPSGRCAPSAPGTGIGRMISRTRPLRQKR